MTWRRSSLAILIKHGAGNFELWLAPEQVRSLTTGDDPKRLDYAEVILNEPRSQRVRAEANCPADLHPSQDCERRAGQSHTMLAICGSDGVAGGISVRLHGKSNIGTKPKAEAVADVLAAIQERRE
jgi:threonyl-tRNA synthetase